MEDAIRDEVLNLHDTFLTANFCRTLMERTPPQPGNPTSWTATDRARLERLWWAMTFVLVEAWESKSDEVASVFHGLDSAPALDGKLDDLRSSGVITLLRECRHYMCHRDRRAYWDQGRMAPIGHLGGLRELSQVFGAVFLEALDAIKS